MIKTIAAILLGVAIFGPLILVTFGIYSNKIVFGFVVVLVFAVIAQTISEKVERNDEHTRLKFLLLLLVTGLF